jgi:hypothetical protein
VRFPDFFIVGAAKSGTTALWKYLGSFPEIFMTDDIQNKELGYFSKDYGINSKDEYLGYFRKAKKEQIIGESCHAYLTSPESAEWIKREAPDSKIIIVLRNPAKRAFSLFSWMVMNGYEWAAGLDMALELEESRSKDVHFRMNLPQPYHRNYEYFSSGLYYEQVSRYLNVFSADKCKIVIFEEFIKDPNRLLNEILVFLGAEKKDIAPLKKINESYMVFSPRLQFYLQNTFPHIRLVTRLFPRKRYKISAWLKKLNTNKMKKARINADTYTRLMKKYESDISKLSGLLDKDLSRLWR